jgi:hypothetical protein
VELRGPGEDGALADVYFELADLDDWRERDGILINRLIVLPAER